MSGAPRGTGARALVAAVVAALALVVGRASWARSGPGRLPGPSALLVLAVFVVAAVLAVRGAAGQAQRAVARRAGLGPAGAVRLVCLVLGYSLVVLAVVDLAGLRLDTLLVGGALTGAVIGIAAQQVLGNLFAGLVLLLARPYRPGESIRVYAGALNGPHDGTVESADLLFTVLRTADGPLRIPNSALLAAAVGPVPADPDAAVGEAGTPSA